MVANICSANATYEIGQVREITKE
ncbi:Protein of unknown function [Bacillus cereus]|nr:Protein of unknown function [Bacillus cereus]